MKRILKWIFRIVLVLFILGFLLLFVAYWRSTNNCDRLSAAPSNPTFGFVIRLTGMKTGSATGCLQPEDQVGIQRVAGPA